MNACYILSALSFLCVCLAAVQGYIPFMIFKANHITFSILAIIIYLFTQTLNIFFFVGTGVSIRDFVKDNNLDTSFHRRSIAIKRAIYPPILMDIFLVSVVFISGGAVHTGDIPDWAHGLLFFVWVIHFVKMFAVLHKGFRDNTGIILEMAEAKP